MWQCGVDQMAAGKGGKDVSQPLCPSARPDMPESTIFGVIGGSADDPHVSYLSEPLPVTQELLALSQPVKPEEVWRDRRTLRGRCLHALRRLGLSIGEKDSCVVATGIG